MNDIYYLVEVVILYFWLLSEAIIRSPTDPDSDPQDPYVLGLPAPDPLGRGTDLAMDPDPSVIKQI